MISMRKWLFFWAVLSLAACSKPDAVVLPDGENVKEPEGLVLHSFQSLESGVMNSVQASIVDKDATRSRISPKSGGGAKVFWSRGDSFNAYFHYDGGFYRAQFTTQDDGVSDAVFTTTNGLPPGNTDFFCFYPYMQGYGTLQDGTVVYSVNLPATQNAVAGSIENGVNLSYAHTTDMGGVLKFYNIPSLLKFRLSGEVVSRVSQVELSAMAPIAGDGVVYEEDGKALFLNTSFTGDVTSQSVILNGPFTAGTDYYLALWPRTLQGFTMTFSDGEGHSTTKRSSKTISFDRSDITDIGTISLGADFSDGQTVSYDPVQMMTATMGTKPVTIAVIPEGFTAAEMSLYEQRARIAINTLFNTEPYKSYKKYFNVYLLKVASSGSGANITDGNSNVLTNTGCYFESGWGQNSYDDMRANDNKVFDFVTTNCPDIVNGIHSIQEVPILMIINDTRYGGICWTYSNGKSYCMAPFSMGGAGLIWSYPEIQPNSDTDWEEQTRGYHQTTDEEYAEVGYAAGRHYNSGDWTNVVVHEFGGHCLARLGDEYWYEDIAANSSTVSEHYYSVPMSLNLTGNYSAPLWQELLDHRSDLIARNPVYARIGIYQGGDVVMFRRWRNERISCMIDNRFYFSAWQRYLIAKRILTLSGDVSSFNYAAWLAKDVPEDPVRDISSSYTPGEQFRGPVYEVGMLPPPRIVLE